MMQLAFAVLTILCVLMLFAFIKRMEKEAEEAEEGSDTETSGFISDFQKQLNEIRKTVPDHLVDGFLLQQREVTLLYHKGVITKCQALSTLTNWLETNNERHSNTD